MLLSKKSIIKWNSKIKKHYLDLGYEFTKMGDEFEVNTFDLTSGSNVLVDVRCDYCNKEYTKKWYRYLLENQKSTIKKDCCKDCKNIKAEESIICNYGVKNLFLLDNIKVKIANTNLKKYGCENPFSNEEIKAKIYDTNMKKYGKKHATQSQIIKNKTQKTCLKKYGVKTFLLTIDQKGENSPRWKNGVSIIRNERSSIEYIEWRKSVWIRDEYTCQCCYSKNGEGRTICVNAHHIFNWKDYPESRYDIENGITLCQNCHNKFHSIYGKRLNNRNQINEFLKLNSHGKKLC